MKKLFTLAACICICILVIGLLPVHGEATVYDSVLRLHVLANSNSQDDQSLKLDVRDKIIEITQELGKDCTDLEEMQTVMLKHMELIKQCAEDEIRSQGYDYPVTVSLEKETYPTKTYASLCFPSGEYTSLQVKIGEAQGENWWCVLFPPLCLDAASSSNEDAFLSVGFTPDQYKIITSTDTPVYQARFKMLEVIEEAVNR